MKELYILLFCLAIFCFETSTSTTSQEKAVKATQRRGKLFNIFQIVRFQNDQCDGGSRNGTCYTTEECESRGGTNSGSCASGYGVCCTFTINCGASSAENCTYFESSSPSAGACRSTICPCNNNICQLRLDFETFVISGPSTASTTVTNIKNGNIDIAAAGIAAAAASQCLTDTFTVTNTASKSSDIICGTNTGQHLYVDTDKGCTDLNFQLGNNGMGTGIANRQWNIKVTQIGCQSPVRAPTGCDQYFFGATSGSVETYNYNNRAGQHLANQDQTMCVRRERGNCRICWYAAAVIDFAVSGMTNAAMGHAHGSKCCGYGTDGVQTLGYDCVQIPGAVKNTNAAAMIKSEICGRSAGLVSVSTGAAAMAISVCSYRTPFYVRFQSDNYELATAATGESKKADAGFRLGYTMDATNCP